MDEVSVRAPATVSNVVCGYDCLGFALEEPFDEITVRKIPERAIKIKHFDDFGLPTDPTKNVAGVSLLAMIDAAEIDFGFNVEITKHIKPGSGIGSSAASACGAVAAANRLLGDRFSKADLIDFAMEGERLASGAKHADNAAPCILGGFVLVRSSTPSDVVSLDFPPLWATVIHPQIEIKTSAARALLPESVPLRDAVRQWSNLGAFVAALAKGDYALISRSMKDFIVEPVRKSLIPKFDEVRSAAFAAGAIGGGISGSGPSMFMLCVSPKIAEFVEAAIRNVYILTGIEFNTYISNISKIGPDGVRIIQSH